LRTSTWNTPKIGYDVAEFIVFNLHLSSEHFGVIRYVVNMANIISIQSDSKLKYNTKGGSWGDHLYQKI
jgi:hypothetical protein